MVDDFLPPESELFPDEVMEITLSGYRAQTYPSGHTWVEIDGERYDFATFDEAEEFADTFELRAL